MLDGTLLIKRDGVTLPSAPRAVALRGTRLVAVSADGEAIVGDCDAEGRWHLERRLGLEGAPAHIALGRSGRMLLSRPETRDRASVYDLDAGRMVLDIAGSPGRTGSAVVTLTSAGDREYVLVSTASGELRAHELSEGAPVVEVSTPSFVFEHFVPVAGGETVIALGHYLSEGRDSLLTFAMASLLSDPGIVERVVAGHLGIDDYAYALAAGPCARDAVVIYRDPEDEEQPSEPDEDEDAPPDRRDVYGFHGFYLRRLADAALLDRVEAGIGIATGTEVFATASTIVVRRHDRVEILDRRHPTAALGSLGGAIHGFDPERGRIVSATPDGSLEIHEVAA